MKSTFSCLCLLVLFCASAASGQEVSAGITGEVTDASGSAVTGAAVTARDMDRGTVWTTVTNELGIYFYPRIPAGRYELKVEARGFKAATRPNVVLEVNQRARINVTLEVGQITESIEVVGDAALLNTDTTIVGSTVTTTTLINTPLASRNFTELTLLTPGTVTTSLSGMRNSERTGYGASRPYVNGNRAQANNFLLDGIDNNQVSDNYTAYQPNVDAIQEVNTITNNASAEFGNFQGGIINVVMKGGTNEFHGSAFEFLQNDKLNANNWARNWQGTSRAPVRLNTFGGTFGGPIVRDRLFFFANYQGIRRSFPAAPTSISVIPDEFRRGDFSRLLTERGVQLYDPLDVDANGRRRPFLNNQIPIGRMDPVARALFSDSSLYPSPINGDLQFNQLTGRGSTLKTDQGDIKVDYKPTASDNVYFRYSHGWQVSEGVETFPLLFPAVGTSPFKAGVLNWSRSFSPTIVNEARFGINRIVFDNAGDDKGLGNVAEQLGIAGANDRGPGIPELRFNGGLATFIGRTNVGLQNLFANTSFHLADNLTIVKGRHMVKTGGQVLRQRMNTLYTGNWGRTGFIQFDGRFTGADVATPGLAEADFFLGAVARTGRGVTGLWGHRKTILGFYVQDDWRVTDSLTLNLGLRWEWHQPLYEVKDRQANFEPFSGRLLLAGQDGNSRALYEPFNKDFQPRIGFAYTPVSLGRKTVFRGAYTISSFMEGSGTNLRLPINPPFQTESEGIFDTVNITRPVVGTGQFMQTLAQGDPFRNATIRLWDPFVRPANTQQWSLIIEQQLPGESVASVGYIGQKGHHLIVPMPYFQRRLLPNGQTERSPYLSGNPLLANISQISGTESNGNMQYHGMQAQYRKRMSMGLTMQASYTFSKTMTDAIGFYGDVGQIATQSAYWQYLYDRKAEWGPAFFDATHNFTSGWVYELPFGKGRTFGQNWNPMVSGILGNWQLGGLLYLRSGFAMTVQANDQSGTNSRGPRADRIGDGTDGPKTVGPLSKWLDTSAYRTPLPGTLGSAGVGTFRGPQLRNLDLSIQKVFPFTERYNLEFRGEMFNVTNTPAFQGVNRNASSVNFGEVIEAQDARRVQFALKFWF
jgi:hypothetical protein